MAKSLLNNLLGRFGISLAKLHTIFATEKKLNEIAVKNRIKSLSSISDKHYLINYMPYLDPYIIKSHDLDIVKLANKYPSLELQNVSNTSVVISAANTAFARIHMSKLKYKILEWGGKIFYSDTDSSNRFTVT